MHLHFLGICGTFMGSLALLARQLGHRVTGSDRDVYPPMSEQLSAQGIEIWPGYDPAHVQPAPDLVIVGNAMSRGNAAVEFLLDAGIPYASGPQWLCEHVLCGRWVLAVSGTHGKTRTSSMLAWVLQDNGMQPGYLIGGVPANFPTSADLGQGHCFVIEADEYDTAFFDKRSKFVHYRPRTVIINNLEFDHADIFPDLASIQRQFHHLLRTVPAAGRVLFPQAHEAVEQVLAMGCWTPVESFSLGSEGFWRAQKLAADGSRFAVYHADQRLGEVSWSMLGDHNVSNGLAAIGAAAHAGVSPLDAMASLGRFRGVKRRLEYLGQAGGVAVYDDFAHHPTAISSTLAGLRERIRGARLVAVLEPRSNTMQMGVHRGQLNGSVAAADLALWLQPEGLNWQLASVLDLGGERQRVCHSVQQLLDVLLAELRAGDHVVIMSNGSFQGLPRRLLADLELRPELVS